MKSYNKKIIPNFHNNKISKEGFQSICLSVILIDSVFRTAKNYYLQVFQKNVNLLLKNIIEYILKYIIEDIEISSDSNKEKPDEETLLQRILIMKKILMKKILKKKILAKNIK